MTEGPRSTRPENRRRTSPWITLNGDPAVSGDLEYVVTDGNDEDGETDYDITIKQAVDPMTGKATCTVKSAKEAAR